MGALAAMCAGFFAAAAGGLEDEEGGKTESRLSLEGEAWWIAPAGWLFITRGSEPGSATRVRQGHEMDLDDAFQPRVESCLRVWGPHALGVRAVPFSESGTTAAPDDFIYHGTLFPAGREVRSKIDLLRVDADYQYAMEPVPALFLTPYRTETHHAASRW